MKSVKLVDASNSFIAVIIDQETLLNSLANGLVIRTVKHLWYHLLKIWLQIQWFQLNHYMIYTVRRFHWFSILHHLVFCFLFFALAWVYLWLVVIVGRLLRLFLYLVSSGCSIVLNADSVGGEIELRISFLSRLSITKPLLLMELATSLCTISCKMIIGLDKVRTHDTKIDRILHFLACVNASYL